MIGYQSNAHHCIFISDIHVEDSGLPGSKREHSIKGDPGLRGDPGDRGPQDTVLLSSPSYNSLNSYKLCHVQLQTSGATRVPYAMVTRPYFSEGVKVAD